MSFTDLSSLSPGLLARAVVSLEDVSLRSTELTSQQVEAICAAIGKDTMLTRLDLADNRSVASVDPDLLATAVNLLEDVNIGFVWIKQPQLQALFTTFKEQTKLKILKIGFNEIMANCGPDTPRRVAKKHAQVKVTLADVKRDTVLEAETIPSIEKAFLFGHFQISLEQDRFRMIKTQEQLG